METGLIVVDAQRFFLRTAPKDMAPKIARHIAESTYAAIGFTVFKNLPGSNFEESLGWRKCSTEEDLELPEDFTPFITDENVFTRTAYSGFRGTALDEYLVSRSVQKVNLCDLDTDACLLATAFDAFDRGYQVNVSRGLTFSSGGLDNEAWAVIKRNLLVRE